MRAAYGSWLPGALAIQFLTYRPIPIHNGDVITREEHHVNKGRNEACQLVRKPEIGEIYVEKWSSDNPALKPEEWYSKSEYLVSNA